jgi:cysteine dioxygenase
VSCTPIDALVDALTAEFARDARGRHAAQLLAEYAAAHDDWRRFAHFSTEFYTRNLVRRCDAFEMIVLCWSPGQTSPIHDHAGQRCWMTILDGSIEEVQYAWPRTSGRLVESGRREFARGKVAYVDDDIGLHCVRPAAGGPGVSLHLYSRPIDVCRTYDERTGAVLERTMLYHSVAGVPAARA